ncbi:MAG: hypothetical protein JWM68_2535 [Verrucomicrobiales bacterium]|nr:hypothetical protein [Verrucomicrobiales bacterium]
MDFLTKCLSWVCGQAADRSWVFGDEMFPLCQRCTGIYAGAAIAAIIFCCTRRRPHRWTMMIHVLLVGQIIPAGLHWCFDTPVLRTLSGGWFGIGLIGLMSRQIAVRFHSESRTDSWGILTSFLAVTLLASLTAYSNAAAANLLAVLVVVGLFSIAVLIVANVVQLYSLWRDEAPVVKTACRHSAASKFF